MSFTPIHDPQLEKILKIMNDLPVPSSVEQRRANFARLCSFSGEPDSSVAWSNLHTPNGQALRLYEPAHASTSALLLYFHGGGFVAGNLETHHAALSHLAALSGMRIAHLDYRRGPENRFPAALEDALSALAYIQAERLSANDQILVGGDSAGGNLAAALAAEKPREIAGQLLLYPTLDAHFSGESWRTTPPGFIANAKDSSAFNALYARDSSDYDDPRFSPLLRGDLHGLPPTALFVGKLDAARSDSEAYAQRLRAQDVEAEVEVLPGLPHGFLTMGGELPLASEALQKAAMALRKMAAK